MPAPTDIYVADDAPLLASTDEAATRVLSPLRNARAHLEKGGVLLQSPSGQYAYTSPVDQSEHGGALGVHIPPGWKMAGIFHSHLKDDTFDKETFSADDIDQANRLKVPSYVLFQNSGQIRGYTPGSTHTHLQDFGGSMVNVARGDPLSLPQSPAAIAYADPDYNAVAAPEKQKMLAQALRTPDDSQ